MTFDGEHLQRRGRACSTRSPTRCREIYFGGSSPAAGDVAAKHADVYLTWGEPPDAVREKIEWIRKLAADEGREVRFGIRMHTITRDTAEEAWAEADRLLAGIDADGDRARSRPGCGAASPRASAGCSSSTAAARTAWRSTPTCGPASAWSAAAPAPRSSAATSRSPTGSRSTPTLGIDEFVLSGYPHLERPTGSARACCRSWPSAAAGSTRRRRGTPSQAVPFAARTGATAMTGRSLSTNQDLDPARLREAFGIFPSGVVAVAAEVDGASVGLAASSFTSVSLDPPLVSFSVANTSKTWPDLRRAGHLGVTVLADHHDARLPPARRPGGAPLRRLSLTVTDDGAVTLDDGLARFDCTIHDEVEAGDHIIVLLRAARRRARRHLPAAGLPPQRLRVDQPHRLTPDTPNPEGPPMAPLTRRHSPAPRRRPRAASPWPPPSAPPSSGTTSSSTAPPPAWSSTSSSSTAWTARPRSSRPSATFAVGFLARPIGGLIFGHFGDRIGRKKMLLLTLRDHGRRHRARSACCRRTTRSASWAPILLVTLRVLQGIGVGGEYGGAVLLAVEYAPAERRGFFGSFAHIGVPGGLLLASRRLLAGQPAARRGVPRLGLARLLPGSACVLLAIGAYIRLSVMETPAFAQVQERKEVSAAAAARPARARSRKRLLLGMGTRYIEGFTFNFFSVYLLAYVVTNLELPRSLALGGDHGRRRARRRAGADHRCALGPGRPQAGLPGRRLARRCCSRSRPPPWCSPGPAGGLRWSSCRPRAPLRHRSTARSPRSGPSCSTPATATRR